MAGREVYAFGDFTLDVAERRLCRGLERLHLAPKAQDLLVHLVRQAGHLVTKRELLDQVWAGSFVEEGILAVHVSGLRKALRDDDETRRFIETVAGSGYRFVAPVTRLDGARPAQGAGTGFATLPVPPEARELVGHGRSHLLSASRSEVPQAIAAYRAAVDLAPTWATPHAGLARAYCAEADMRIAPPADAYARARSAALCALGMDDRCADAHLALGTVLFLGEWNWIGAERSLRRAQELAPGDADVSLMLGRLLDALGRGPEALELKLRVLERDPSSPAVHLAISMSYWYQRRYDEAIAWANKTLALEPRHLLAREHLAGAYWKLGDFDRQMAEALTHARIAGAPEALLESLERTYATSGRPGVTRWIVAQAAEGARIPDLQAALLHGELGDLDAALRHLDRALDGHDSCLVDLAVGPQYDDLRRDPRFRWRLLRMGLGDVSASRVGG